MIRFNLSNRNRQRVLIFICFLVYSFAYVGRYSYNANLMPVMTLYNVTRAEAGLAGTFFFFAYGVGQLFHAIFCKYYPRRIVVPGVLLISSVLNLCLFFGVPFVAIKYLWLLNGFCQSVLWPTLVLTLGETIEPELMKQAVFVMSLTVVVGTVIAYGGSAVFTRVDFFKGSFLLGAGLMLCIGVIWLISYDTLSKQKIKMSEQVSRSKVKSEQKSSVGFALVGLVTVSGILLAIDNFVKEGLNTWTPVILREQLGTDDSLSIVLTIVLPIFGAVGTMFALRLNQRVKDFRLLNGILFLLLCGSICGICFCMKQGSIFGTVAFLGFVSCFAYGINSIVTNMMPLALRDQANSGFLAGVMNSAGYVGSTASAYGLGYFADRAGWETVMNILLFTSLGAVIISFGTTFLSKHNKRR